ncbi:MAG: hypothetical protein GY952_14615 [Rhodobacteraceae bacterium]|nr:hypothetical protein [Paracoccaceae bacterium]
MLTRLAGASVRAALVAATVAVPAVMLPDVSPISAELSILLAAIAAAFVIMEYGFISPSLVEFRFAAPYNRCRFAILVALLVILVFAFRSGVESTVITVFVSSIGTSSFEFWDFPFSPLHSFLTLAHTAGPESQSILGLAAASALTVAALGVTFLSAVIWKFAWPLGRENFNLWVNMPTIDLAQEQDSIPNLRRSALISLLFGFTFPYIAPQAALTFLGHLEPVSSNNSQFLVWLIAVWCFVPAASVLRGLAVLRIANLIGQDFAEDE